MPRVAGLRLAAFGWLGPAVLGLAACGASTQAEAPAAPAGERPALRVTTAVAAGRTVQRSVETVGSFQAWDEGLAKTQVSGTIVRLHADLGDSVRPGQPLAELDRREADLAVAQLQADLLAAGESLLRARAAAEAGRANLRRVQDSLPALRAEVERMRAEAAWRKLELARSLELRAKDLIATREVDQARTQSDVAGAGVRMAETALGQHGDQVRAAEAQLQAELNAIRVAEAQVQQRQAALDLGKKRLADLVVPAPLAGKVARRHASSGEFVKDGTILFTVVATDPLKYTGTVPERTAPEVQVGQPVRLEVEAFPGRVFTGQVTRVAPVVDVQTRTLALEARVPNGEGALRPGFFGRGAVWTRRQPGVAFVPAEAVSAFVGITKVFVVADGHARERAVRVGPSTGGQVEVLEGVRPGEVVATSGLGQLYDGAPVTVAAPAPAR
jgi:RND family efflux transporter MFP subunit